METLIHRIGSLAQIDERLDELKDEYGDLPIKVKEQESKVSNLVKLVDDTKKVLKETQSFLSSSNAALTELKDKEEKLAKQQFLVKNNKEFEAMNEEIQFLKDEYENLSTRIRKESIQEENIKKILSEQEDFFKEQKKELDELEVEIKQVNVDQNLEVNSLFKKREKIAKTIDAKSLVEYDRIRSYHPDAAVNIKKNSCTGCFSSIPPQQIVEIRNNLDKIFKCENCGRVLIAEEVFIEAI